MFGSMDPVSVLTMTALAIPVVIVLGMALLLAVGGVIGCARCIVAAPNAAGWVSAPSTGRKARVAAGRPA